MNDHAITITGELIEVGDDEDSRPRITVVADNGTPNGVENVVVYLPQECVSRFGPHVYSKIRITIEVLPW